MPEECIFCKIVKGEVPSNKVYEDEDVLAILDINPANEGHTLILPKKHVENIYKIDEQLLAKTIAVTKKVAESVKENLDAEGVNILQNNGKIAGQLVNHIHFHVIPREEEDQVMIGFQREQKQPQELQQTLQKIKLSEKIAVTKPKPAPVPAQKDEPEEEEPDLANM